MDNFNLLSDTLSSILKLKLSEKYHEKYDEALCHLSDLILSTTNVETFLSKLLNVNCKSLRVVLEYKYNSKSQLGIIKKFKITKQEFESLKEHLDKHLNYFDVLIETKENPKNLRYNKIIKHNCEALQLICNPQYSSNFIRHYNDLIKLNCNILFEIISVCVSYTKQNIRIVTLSYYYAKVLKYVLKLKINDMERVEMEEENLQSLLKMHKSLYDELYIYVNKIVYK